MKHVGTDNRNYTYVVCGTVESDEATKSFLWHTTRLLALNFKHSLEVGVGIVQSNPMNPSHPSVLK